jgi:hypothetical protein
MIAFRQGDGKMTQSKLLLVVAMTVLMFGFAGAKSSSAAQMQKDVVIAAEDAAPDDESGTGSAKMGEGTQTGDQGATKENDTQKVDQPPRRNPTTGTGDYQEEGAPSDDDQDTDR